MLDPDAIATNYWNCFWGNRAALWLGKWDCGLGPKFSVDPVILDGPGVAVAVATTARRYYHAPGRVVASHIWSFQCHEWGKRFLHAGNAAVGIERRIGRGRAAISLTIVASPPLNSYGQDGCRPRSTGNSIGPSRKWAWPLPILWGTAWSRPTTSRRLPIQPRAGNLTA